ncbi:FBD-associated F-box protein At5g27750-like [Cornus florida]|uniref:FBD-associated F-box protein At5g27750-like n=1 Tax=Cornus florida TaxID=4283 RepID=UPI00289CCF37|nr:FBD-associated F-box protein At5g27750-like [Cornus florida]
MSARRMNLILGPQDASISVYIALKSSSLDRIEFLDDDSIGRLFSSSPVLEDLSETLCEQKDISVFKISAPALKIFIINCYVNVESKYKIVLNTPNLQQLTYNGYAVEGYSVSNINSYVKANFGLSRIGVRDLAVAEFFEGIASRVQWLHLSNATVQTLEWYSYPLPKFHCSTYLELGEMYVTWKLLLDLLNNSLQLETLTFWALSRPRDEDHPSHWYPPENVHSCFSFHLKVIKIKWFVGEDYEIKMAQYFLKNAKVLKKLMIHPTSSKELDVYNKLLLLARSSKTSAIEQIVFVMVSNPKQKLIFIVDAYDIIKTFIKRAQMGSSSRVQMVVANLVRVDNPSTLLREVKKLSLQADPTGL